MSTIDVANITDGTDTVATGYVINGSAKAWVNFNGTGTAAIRDSMNVSSLTDNGTGDYAILFTNSFANPNYAAVGSAHDAGASWSANPNMGVSGTSRVQGSCPFLNANVVNGGQVSDTSIADATYHGDLS